MKKYILPLLMVAGAVATVGFTSDEKPKVLMCNSEDCEMEDTVETSLEETRKKVSSLSKDNATVMEKYDAFAEVINTAYRKERSITAQEVQEICAGVEFAAEKHRLQTRKNAEKTPYISHPIGVAHHLMNIGDVRDSSVIIGALLHDTLEDTQTTYEEIVAKFGSQVADYVRELTDNRSLATEERKRQQVINASHKSKGAAQIKLADKLYNLNDLFENPPKDWTQSRIDHYYEWAQSVINRLPKANDKLLGALDEVIDSYWEKQQEQ